MPSSQQGCSSQAEDRCGSAQTCLTPCFILAVTLILLVGLTKVTGPSSDQRGHAKLPTTNQGTRVGIVAC